MTKKKLAIKKKSAKKAVKKKTVKKKHDSVGNPRTFATPADLYREFEKYVKWVDDNPWQKIEANKSTGKLIKIPTQRPYTLVGFAVFCGCHRDTIHSYGDKEQYPEYSDIYKLITETFYAQKFEGAAVGAFNPHIIARDLGLKDKHEHNVGGEIKTISSISQEELDKMSAEDLAKLALMKLQETNGDT